MTLHFRNLDLEPATPVEQWGAEGVLIALDRGDLRDWTRVKRAVERSPWGPVSRQVETAAGMTEDRGAAAWARGMLAHVRDQTAAREVEAVVSRLRGLVQRSGLTQADFAARLGTSASRLSTYLTGKTVPAATLMVRAEQVARTA